MGNYENINAREWDLFRQEPQNAESSSNEWEVVGSSKKARKREQQRHPQTRQAPPRLPSGQREQRIGQERHGSRHQWETTRAEHQSGTQRRIPPSLILDADNEAQVAWRKHEPPVGSIRLPEELILDNKRHEAVAKSRGSFIFSENPRDNSGAVTFDLWGSKDAVAATKFELNQWIRAATATPSKASTRKSLPFAKVHSLTDSVSKRAEKRWKQEVTRQKFRRFPPIGTRFGAIGSFHWPVAEHRPEEILGLSYEALDQIRMDCRCYIVFSKEKSVFQVSGATEDVPKALARLRQTCFQIAARQISAVRLYLLHPSNIPSFPTSVSLVRYQHPAYTSMDGRIGRAEESMSPRGQGIQLCTGEAMTESALNAERVRDTFFQAVRRLHYYRGCLLMRIRLGTFLATQYPRSAEGVYKLDDFKSMVTESRFKGEVTAVLGNKFIEESLLVHVQKAKDILAPHDWREEDLRDVKPTYSATFNFEDQKSGDLRLTMSWNEVNEDLPGIPSFERKSKKWVRLERDTDTTSSIVDSSLIDLSTGRAWHFDLQAAQAVDHSRLAPVLIDFADYVRIDPVAVRNQRPFVIFPKVGVGLKSVHQRTVYSYGIVDSDYTLELAQFQDLVYEPSRKALPPAGQPKASEPRWSVNVYRTEWDTMLVRNERLAVGERADWPDDVDTWFPEDITTDSADQSSGAGFEQLVKKLMKIKAIVTDV